MADIQQVLEAARLLGQAHRAFRHARAEGERRIVELQDGWVRLHEHLLVDGADPEYLDDDLIAAARAYLLTGQAGAGEIPNDVQTALDEGRTALAEDLKTAMRLTEPAKEALHVPTAEFRDAVRSWFITARAESDLDGWRQVLQSWRKALSMTTREAAAALDVSPSAIVRYEAGNRSPSIPQLSAMIDCVVGWDATVEDADMRTAARAVTRWFGDDPDLSTDFLEKADIGLKESAIEHAALQREVEDALDRLSVARLRVLALLVATPTALDALSDLAESDPLRSVMDALSRVHEAGRKAHR